MKRFSKSYQKKTKLIDKDKVYNINEAIMLMKQTSITQFNSSVDVNVLLNVDPKKASQQIRGVLTLPHGTGRKTIILVLTNQKAKEAQVAGADFVGGEDLINKIKKENWFKFDVVVATPDIMPKLVAISRLLGPKKLMPSVKNGTITDNVKEIILELKKGKLFYRVDKFGTINTLIGKVSFSDQELLENYQSLLSAIRQARPADVKGRYIKKIVLNTTMGPGLVVDSTNV